MRPYFRLFTARLLLVAGLSLSLALSAFAYGEAGHEAIAAAAQANLNANVKTKIEALLAQAHYTGDLASFSTWPDQVRAAARHRGPLAIHAGTAPTPEQLEAQAFNAAFPGNAGWHYANLPLATNSYIPGEFGAGPDDVVQLIERCVKILETPDAALPAFPAGMTKFQALRCLVHFVGDIHQPLHVGSGYFAVDDHDIPTLVTDPAQAANSEGDEGGNMLYFSASLEVHALWDVGLVETLDKIDNAPLADQIWHVPGTFATPGDYHKWPEQWATDSVHQAMAAYQGIVFQSVTKSAAGKVTRIHVLLPAGYRSADGSQVQREGFQLAAGAHHLADLLNAIQWP